MRTAPLALVLALALVGCTDGTTSSVAAPPTTVTVTVTSPVPSSPVPSSPVPSTTPPSTTPVVTTAAPGTTAAPEPALPDCSQVEPTSTATGWDHPDCEIAAGGDPAATAVVRYGETDPATGETPITIDVGSVAGVPPFRIVESIGATFGAPRWQDLDADGSPELLVPLITGNVNTDYAVWASPEPGVDLQRAGEVGAVDFAISQDGYIVARGRSGATTVFAAFLRLFGADLLRIATVESALDSGTCSLVDDGGLAAIGLDAATARERFCDDPALTA
jgi:hypothetical protein